MVRLKEARALPDKDLVALSLKGDDSAFDMLVRRYKDRVYHVLFHVIAHGEEALDLTQETFVRAYRALPGFRGESQFRTWLFRIALNLARNRLRDFQRKGRNRSVSLESLKEQHRLQSVSSSRTPDQALREAELRAALEACLHQLTEPLRLSFSLRIFEGWDYESIAELMDCPKGTVKSRLHTARMHLRRCLEKKEVLDRNKEDNTGRTL